LNFKVNSAGGITQTRNNARRTKDKKMKHQETLNRIAALDAAIHNPARLMIVYLLSRQGALDYLTLMRETQLSSGNLTTHLNTLAGSSYIEIVKSFRGRKPHTTVHLTAPGRAAYENWGQQIWNALPSGFQDTIRKRIVHQELDLSRYNLSLQDWDASYRDNNPYRSATLRTGGRIPWPPLEEAWTL